VLVKKMRGQLAAVAQPLPPLAASHAMGCAPAVGQPLAYTSSATSTTFPLGSKTSKYIAEGAANVNVKNTSGPSGVQNPGVSALAVTKLKGKSPPAEMSVAFAHASLGVVQSESLKSVQPAGQQPSPSAHAVCCRPWFTQAAVHVPPFTSVGRTQPCCAQLTGQFPAMAVSHVSPLSTTPLPQTAAQFTSLFALHPAGQQPSLVELHAVMGVLVQVTLHAALDPLRESVVHALPSSHVMAVQSCRAGAASHVSRPSSTPLPQAAAQFTSLLALHPAGQQPSLVKLQVVMAVLVHLTLQLAFEPLRTSVVHALPSSHVKLVHVGDAGATSQVSAPSRTPFPQTAPQSLSFVALHPGAQHPSALTHAVMFVFLQVTLQVASEPMRASAVQLLPSLHVRLAHVGEAGATSQVSPGSMRPLPQPGQSTSVVGPHPVGQNPSAGPHARGAVVQR
jgi:hypothetical protein